MSAPKPKVRRLPDGFWTWRCRCGAFDMSEWTRTQLPHWQLAWNATIHSRTHTAERLAQQLEEWAGEPTDNHQDGAYWQGYLEGAADAQRETAQLIRKHLVKEAP